MEGLEDELTCPVCLELYTCPLLLPCQHNLCRRCAEAFLEAPAGEPEGAQAACSSEPAPPSPEDTPGSFACPTCREEVHLGDRGVDGLRRNLLLQNIIDSLVTKLRTVNICSTKSYHATRFKHAQSQLKRDAVPCLVCDAALPRDAVKSCTTCKLSYCRECLQLLHPSRGVLANHQLVSPMESFDTMQKIVMCPEHKNKPVELYCMEDDTPVCSLCKLVGKHKEHDVSGLEEVFEGKKGDLQKVIQEMEGKMKKETTKIKELETKKAAIESHGDQLKSQIQTECNALINIIREREVAMVAEVDEVVRDDTSKIQIFIDNSEKKVKNATSCLAYAKEAVKETDPACFLQTDQLVSSRVEQSNSAFVDDEEHTRIPADRLSVDLSSVETSLEGLDLPHVPVISQEKCRATEQGVTVTWDADGQDADSKFDVLCCCDGDKPVSKINIQQNSCTVKGLKEDTSYSVNVTSTNKCGTAKSDSFPMKTTRKPKWSRPDEKESIWALDEIVPEHLSAMTKPTPKTTKVVRKKGPSRRARPSTQPAMQHGQEKVSFGFEKEVVDEPYFGDCCEKAEKMSCSYPAERKVPSEPYVRDCEEKVSFGFEEKVVDEPYFGDCCEATKDMSCSYAAEKKVPSEPVYVRDWKACKKFTVDDSDSDDDFLIN
ncbi:E3 ubiquitin-protein ligase Midline-1-like [Branchiostoma floridae x Branchiostoma belcheri]